MNAFRLLLALAVVGCLAGCAGDPKSGKGFTLPEGDAEQGQAVFAELRCYDCHSVAGVELPKAEEPEQTIVRLGGEVSRIRTYGELVTSIINPSHRLARSYAVGLETAEEAESPMKNYNDVMTVDQLIDVVAFLQAHYKLKQYEPTPYRPYFH